MSKTLLLLAEGFETYEASVFIDVLAWNLADGDGTTEMVSCAIRKQIQSTGGLGIIVDKTVDEVDVSGFDALAVPGGFERYGFYEDAYDERFLDVIRKFDAAGKIIASICVGALPLGKSGILAGKTATTYNGKDKVRQKALAGFGVNVLDEPMVKEGNIITSQNPATALGVAFELLKRLTSRQQMEKIKEMMGFS